MSEDNNTSGMPTSRGPAYPFISLTKVIERIEQIHAQGMSRHAVSPMDFYRAWGYQKESGNSRQTMAALNHYALVKYIGRGKDRKVKLSPLANRILLDKVPDSPKRAEALRIAATSPTVFHILWEKYRDDLPPDYAIQTFLTLEHNFTEESAQKVIDGYRETFSYADLKNSANLPDDEPEIKPETSGFQMLPKNPSVHRLKETNQQDVLSQMPQTAAIAESHSSVPLPSAAQTEIKIMLDGDLIRVSAVVNAKSAKKLIKALTANIALLNDDDEDEKQNYSTQN